VLRNAGEFVVSVGYETIHNGEVTGHTSKLKPRFVEDFKALKFPHNLYLDVSYNSQNTQK
jgi:hypothetical protein